MSRTHFSSARAMDLLYLSETIAYNSARNAIYERYQPKAWQMTYKQEKAQKVAESNRNHQSGDGCKLCREKQRRTLGSYIRSKSIECSAKSRIAEEEEESAK